MNTKHTDKYISNFYTKNMELFSECGILENDIKNVNPPYVDIAFGENNFTRFEITKTVENESALVLVTRKQQNATHPV
jgi:hypothetical protein